VTGPQLIAVAGDFSPKAGQAMEALNRYTAYPHLKNKTVSWLPNREKANEILNLIGEIT
tara:strand:- start:646 stop:822 length:177 start_codon:yes stop_codon:yes gene_type:complete